MSLAKSYHQVVRPAVMLMAAFVLLLGGCADPAMQAQFEELMVVGRQVAVAQDATPGNRLLIQGIDGNLYTTRPDGSDPLALTRDASRSRQYLQPTWSPSAEHIAYAEVDSSAGTTQSALVVGSFTGLTRQRYLTPFAPFYFHWSPDATRLAYLSNWRGLQEPTVALRLLDLSEEQSDSTDAIRTLAEGNPLYFTWSPDGERILAHIGNERLEFRTLDGEGEPLALTAAVFPAPQWSSDGSQLLYALGDAVGQRLILADTQGLNPTELTNYSESIAFSLNAGGDQIAYVVTPRGMSTAAFGPLYVVNAAGNRTVELSARPVLAFFWSPDGEKLAYLEIDDSSETVQLRWVVWDGQRKQTFSSVSPTRTFLQSYLAFFDQYARSMTIWSPDSSAFAYAANAPGGNGPHIYVQELAADAPTEIGRGVFVSWSPR
jgi:TolB protein